jgi:hypothetical protein
VHVDSVYGKKFTAEIQSKWELRFIAKKYALEQEGANLSGLVEQASDCDRNFTRAGGTEGRKRREQRKG